ncbi:hypothetical protein [Empedobacter brevis]|uniref:Uncharacterized protein n=1 Tax=Empedobacter brevis NBRC 14943 = ATCC 43319 TaxID=1218108 RepID=A0A511NLN6_9FLAO|nr:hypothetical protein [Empedobacter brevis]GEM53709.1 hypothetical protein EB1_34990 [Empedobacter brevis NBRC 14943 = ATCC 43319]
MKNLTLLELQEVNGGCATCKSAGKAVKKAWNHVKDFAEGLYDGLFG